jgi:hypothetical protein
MALDPLSSSAEIFLLNSDDSPIRSGADIEEKVPVFGNDVHQTGHNALRFEVRTCGRGTIVAVRVWIHAEIAFPFPNLDGVVAGIFRGVEVSWNTAAIVEENLLPLCGGVVEVFCGKLCGDLAA